jgi:hypothetical protein
MPNICSNCNDVSDLVFINGLCSNCKWAFDKGKAEAEAIKEPFFSKILLFGFYIFTFIFIIFLLSFSNLHNVDSFRSLTCTLSGGNYTIVTNSDLFNQSKNTCVHINEDIDKYLLKNENESTNLPSTEVSLSQACSSAVEFIRKTKDIYKSGLAITDNELINQINNSLEQAKNICSIDEFNLWYENEYAYWVNNPNY